MRMYPTKVVNIIGGPGCGKALFSSNIIAQLSLRHKIVQSVPDIAKSMVWQRNFQGLSNQYQIGLQHFQMLDLLDGEVEFLVCEGSLPQLLFYNKHYADNICDIAKTRLQIRDWYMQHSNINVLIERGELKYVNAGRFQNEEQARDIDRGLRALLQYEGLAFTPLKQDVETIRAFAAALK